MHSHFRRFLTWIAANFSLYVIGHRTHYDQNLKHMQSFQCQLDENTEKNEQINAHLMHSVRRRITEKYILVCSLEHFMSAVHLVLVNNQSILSVFFAGKYTHTKSSLLALVVWPSVWLRHIFRDQAPRAVRLASNRKNRKLLEWVMCAMRMYALFEVSSYLLVGARTTEFNPREEWRFVYLINVGPYVHCAYYTTSFHESRA